MPVTSSKNTKTLKRFSAALRAWFESSGYKQADFAPKVGLKQGRFNEILHGKPCSLAVMERIAEVIGVDIQDFFEQGRVILGDRARNPLPDWLAILLPDLATLNESEAKIVLAVVEATKSK
jgi:transcriptional regulator with XRE-family HTH domain